jgi:hypothetical protein
MPRTRRILGPDGQEHEAEPIGFRSAGEHFNEYLLDDGTILRIKLVVTEVLRGRDVYDALGNPMYYVSHQEVTALDVPDDLKGG